MKRAVVLLVLLAVMVSGVFAMDKTVGGGLLYNGAWTRFDDTYYKTEYTLSRTGLGAFGFFGISQYLELNFGILAKIPNKITAKDPYYGTVTYTGDELGLDTTSALQLGIYGKYPIPLSDRLVIFPTGGVDFEFTIGTEADEWGWAWWHDLWFRVGGGVDFFLTDRLFLRSHIIYGLGIPIGGPDWDDLDMKLSHGLLIKAGVGFMF